jgi:hypothetical protein
MTKKNQKALGFSISLDHVDKLEAIRKTMYNASNRIIFETLIDEKFNTLKLTCLIK